MTQLRNESRFNDESVLLAESKASAPIDVVSLILELGISYKEEAMPDGESGSIRHISPGSFEICVNRNESPQRKRFTAAHELGHYFLHRDLLEPGGMHADRLYGTARRTNPSGSLRDFHERQANQFAAETIMPASELRARYAHGEPDVAELAIEFGVSREAMAWRLYNLNLSSERPR